MKIPSAFRLFLVPLLALIAVTGLSANDTLIQKKIGGDEYLLQNSTNVVIRSEVLEFDLFDDHYDVRVDYQFFNNGPQATLEVGFPYFQYSNPTQPISLGAELNNFRSTVNGIAVPTVDVPAKIKVSDEEEITIFKKKTVTFDGLRVTKIVNTYSSSYGDNYGNATVDYLLGSALTWKEIGLLMVVVRIHSQDLFLDRGISFPLEYFFAGKNDPRMYIGVITKRQLSISDQVSFNLGRKSQFWVYGLPWDYEFETTVYPLNGFRLLTNEQLRFSKALVYAWHGFTFQDPDLLRFFNGTAWYNDRLNKAVFANEKFNETELKNLTLIQAVERERKLSLKVE